MQERLFESVLKEYTEMLMALPGVIGVAQGECEGKACVIVLVAATGPELLAVLPASLDGYLVVAQEVGEIRAPPAR